MPVKVYNRASQRVEEVSSAEAQRGAQQGDYDIVTPTVRVARGNRTATIPADKLLTAIGQGARIVDDDEAARVKLEREESDIASQALGVVEGAAAGATLGASTFIERELFGADPERMAARRDFAGPVAGAAEIVGAVAPALLTGGASTAGTAAGTGARGLAARVAGATPSGFVARQAARAGEGLAARMGTGTASKIVSSGAREFVEGAAAGAGTEIDEASLGNRELSADRIAASGLMGGLFGAGAGVAVPGLAAVASGAVRAPIEGVRKVLGRANAATGGVASREVAELAADSGREMSLIPRMMERSAVASGVDPAVANRVARMADTDEGVADIVRLERDRTKIEGEAAQLVAEKVPAVHRAMDDAQRLAGGESKARYWEKLSPKTPEARRAAIGETEALFTRQRGEIARLASENIDPRFPGAERYHSAILREADDALTKLERDLADSHNLGGRDVSVKHAMAVDAYKRRLGQIIDDNGGWGKARNATPEVRGANAQLRRLYDDAKLHLERRDLYGDAADAQADLNSAYSLKSQADDAYREATAGSGLGTIVNPDGSMNVGKALKLVRAHGRVGGDVTVARLMDALDARVAYFDKLAKYVDMDEAGTAAYRQVKSEVEALRSEFKRQSVDAGKLDDLIEWRKVEGGGSPTILTTGTTLAGMGGGALGGAIGGPVGAAVGALVGGVAMAARQPHTTLHRYAAIRKALDGADKRLGGVVDRMFKAAGAAKVPEIDLPRLPVGALAGATTSRSRKEHDERREQALDKATQFMASGEALVQALNVPLYDVPPGIASVVQDRVQVAAKFLQSKAPKVYKRGNTRLVDPVSAASFERYLEAVVDPIGALERFNSGRITAETAEAIRIVYPALFADIQERIMTKQAEDMAEGREMPYAQRIRLGQIFDSPTDPSLQAAVTTEIQNAIGAAYDEPDPAQQMAAGKKQGELKMDGQSTQTAADRTANWRGQA